MGRRYGNKEKMERKWKKISRMSVTDLVVFKDYLTDQKQQASKVYQDVVNRLNTKSVGV